MQYVLPRTIKQKNLPKLLSTNGIQLRNLLRPENNYYERLKENSKEELNKLLQNTYGSENSYGSEKINVVLDSGALILQQSNFEFCRDWLRLRPEM